MIDGRMKGKSMSEFRFLKNQELIEKLHGLARLEKKTTAEIVEVIAEVDRRKLFLDFGHTSLFSYLTAELGYTPASAQRRIDAARLLSALPELKTDLQTGELNLMQISVLSQGLRQKKKENPKVSVGVSEKRELLEQVKGLDLMQTQKLVSQALDLDVQAQERKHVQQDESLRLELTLSKEQQAQLQRAREILSHKHPSLSWAELFVVLAEELIKRRDLSRETKCRAPRESLSRKPKEATSAASITTSISTSKMGSAVGQKSNDNQVCFASARRQLPVVEPNLTQMHGQKSRSQPRIKRKAIPVPTKRAIHRRDHSCQWIDPISKRKCESRFQLELDHIKPVWAGGENHSSNLQLLCRVHNQLKHKRKTGAADAVSAARPTLLKRRE